MATLQLVVDDPLETQNADGSGELGDFGKLGDSGNIVVDTFPTMAFSYVMMV